MIHKVQTVCGVHFTLEDYLKASGYQYVLLTKRGYILLKPCEEHSKCRESEGEEKVEECNCQQRRYDLKEYDECQECEKIEEGVFYNEDFPEDQFLSYQTEEKLEEVTETLRFLNIPHDQIEKWSTTLSFQKRPGDVGILGMKIKNTCPSLEDLAEKQIEVKTELQKIVEKYPQWKKICDRQIRFFALQDDCRCCS